MAMRTKDMDLMQGSAQLSDQRFDVLLQPLMQLSEPE